MLDSTSALRASLFEFVGSGNAVVWRSRTNLALTAALALEASICWSCRCRSDVSVLEIQETLQEGKIDDVQEHVARSNWSPGSDVFLLVDWISRWGMEWYEFQELEEDFVKSF
jgi:hypothetical protein